MNIYVGNLSYNVEEFDLKEIFEEYGAVSSVKIITDKFTGKSKGFGFVEMDNDDEAKKAIDELNGGELESRKIVVNESQPRSKEDRPNNNRRNNFQRNNNFRRN
ncbi:MAG: RNA-binding protein [Bacteroidales bacterium]|nr:RNA-binding protein [Bacteroidales bacterium]